MTHDEAREALRRALAALRRPDGSIDPLALHLAQKALQGLSRGPR